MILTRRELERRRAEGTSPEPEALPESPPPRDLRNGRGPRVRNVRNPEPLQVYELEHPEAGSDPSGMNCFVTVEDGGNRVKLEMAAGRISTTLEWAARKLVKAGYRWMNEPSPLGVDPRWAAAKAAMERT